jgi:hypothetical protein
MYKIFGVSVGITILVLVGALILGGPTVLAVVAILAVLEISLSFDNAVVNATVIRRMSNFWREIFLTVGVLIAVFGMRLVFPLVLVSITASMSPVSVVRLAIDHPHDYALKLHEAHPAIAAFGGMFLLMIFLDFIFEQREIHWLAPIERALGKIGKIAAISVTVALVYLFIAAETFSKHTAPFTEDGVHVASHVATQTVLASGVLGVATYLLVNALGELFEQDEEEEVEEIVGGSDGALAEPNASTGSSGGGVRKAALATGKAGFFLFLYLEVLDASFSFDGVIGAFAITSDIFVIAAGLGVGAMYIRSLTIYLVRSGTLEEYVFLEHGAHYAIGALAILLFISISHEVPEVVTGLVGIAFIAAALVTSILRNRRLAADEGSAEREPVAVGDG